MSSNSTDSPSPRRSARKRTTASSSASSNGSSRTSSLTKGRLTRSSKSFEDVSEEESSQEEEEEVQEESDEYCFSKIGPEWTKEELELFFVNCKQNTISSNMEANNEVWSKISKAFGAKNPNYSRNESQVKFLYLLHKDVIDKLDDASSFIGAHIGIASLMKRKISKIAVASPKPSKRRKKQPESPPHNLSTESPASSAQPHTPKNFKTKRYLQFSEDESTTPTPNIPTTPSKRKRKVVNAPLPSDATGQFYPSRVEDNSGASIDDSGTDLMEEEANESSHRTNYDKHKKLPLKLRAKKTTLNVQQNTKTSAQVLFSSISPNFKQGELDPQDQVFVEHVEKIGTQLQRYLSLKDARKFCYYEWFYSLVDYGYFRKNEFIECLQEVGFQKERNTQLLFTKGQWNMIRSHFDGKPRRFSTAFLESEKQKLHNLRKAVRMFYETHRAKQVGIASKLSVSEHQNMFVMLDDYDVFQPLIQGSRCLVYLNQNSNIHLGTVIDVDFDYQDTKNRYTLHFKVHLDHESKDSIRTVPDTCIMPFYSFDINEKNSEDNKTSVIVSNGKKRKMSVWAPSTLFPTYPPQYQTPPRRSVARTLYPVKEIETTETQIQATDVARITLLLKKKEITVQKLKKLNDDAEVLLSETKIISDEFKQNYATVIVDLESSNRELAMLVQGDKVGNVVATPKNIRTPKLASTPSSFLQSPPAASRSLFTPHNINPNPMDNVRSVFEYNRDQASSVADAIKKQLLQVAMKDSICKNESIQDIEKTLSGSVLKVITDCIGFIMQLQSCVQNDQLNEDGINLLLQAGVMQLQASCPNEASNPMVRSLLDTTKEIAKQFKELLVAPTHV